MPDRRPGRPRWTAVETRLARSFAQALTAGRYVGRSEAVWAFEQELDRRRRRRVAGFVSPRSRGAISHKLEREVLRPRGSRSSGPAQRSVPWFPEERRVRDAFARALARGRYRSAVEASRAFLAVLERLRRRYPRARWLRPQRTLAAVYPGMTCRARELGRKSVRWWTAQEHRLVSALAQRVVTGRIPNALRGAYEFLRLTAERRARHPQLAEFYPVRNVRVAHTMIWQRAQELGRPLLATLWSPGETELLERHAQGVLSGEFRTARIAARACEQAIETLHRRHPDARWAQRHRNFGTVNLKLKKVLHARARAWRQSKLTDAETKLLDRHARDIAAGRLALRRAAERCYREFGQRYRRFLAAHPELPGVHRPRTYGSVHAQLTLRSRALGRRSGWRPWGAVELKLAREYVARFKATRHRKHFYSSHTAARQLRRELARRGYRRRQSACRTKILVMLYGRCPRPHVSSAERQRAARRPTR